MYSFAKKCFERLFLAVIVYKDKFIFFKILSLLKK